VRHSPSKRAARHGTVQHPIPSWVKSNTARCRGELRLRGGDPARADACELFVAPADFKDDGRADVVTAAEALRPINQTWSVRPRA